MSRAADAGAAYGALHRLAEATVGVRLFTVMMVDMGAGLARRAYTSHPEAYPTSGTKPIHRNAWFETLERGETFVAQRGSSTIAEVVSRPRADRPASAAARSSTCRSCVAGRLVGSVNLLDAEGRYTAGILPPLRAALALPALAALLVAERLSR